MWRYLTGRLGFSHRQSEPRLAIISVIVSAMLLVAAFSMLAFFGAAPTSAASTSAAPNAVNWPLIRLQPIASGFDRPIDMVDPHDGTNRLFVLGRGGLIRIIQNGVLLEEPFLDIENKVYADCQECGLLGLAFPPDFAEEGYFFINYSSDGNLVEPDPWDNENNNDHKRSDTVIARLRVSGNPNIANPNSEEHVLVINQPAGNHNGGHIVFGPDDYFYIGMGDGGGGGDEFNNAQDPRSLLGKMLRIEVGATGTYSVPATNPFTNTVDFRDEIWATGLRNPWRFNFDPTTGDLYIADVGQGEYEEVNHIAAAEIGNGGMNFGWPITEGDVCYPPNGAQDCDRTGLVAPVVTYDHELGDCSVTGGYVYHSIVPNQAPVYLYADYCTGRLWGLQRDGDEWVSSLLEDYPFQITSFGEDEDGNIYLVNYAGEVYQIVEQILDLPNSQYLPGLSKRQ